LWTMTCSSSGESFLELVLVSEADNKKHHI
jgi:hypothetical protein